jgi:uncharacterized Zn finger protein (UPF0148 family)
MSEPEISRRCPQCGASFRQGALFCPQCGEKLSQPESANNPRTTRDTGPLDDPSVAASEPSLSDTIIERRDRSADTMAIETPPPSLSDTIAVERPKTAKPEPRVRAAVGAKLQRASTIARGVEGDVKHRVQKVKEISSVVIDEAGYDPSLRFVLVAAALFILFLIVVLLNNVIS